MLGFLRRLPEAPASLAALAAEIAMPVERAYCGADPAYYSGDCESVVVDSDKPKSLDMEFKLLENGRFVCKQVREFAGR